MTDYPKQVDPPTREEPTAGEVEKLARRLHAERFQKRDLLYAHKMRLRMRQEDPFVPEAYDKTATRYKSPQLNADGNRMVRMLTVDTVPTVTPPPQDWQPPADTDADLETPLEEEKERDPQQVSAKMAKWLSNVKKELECYCDHAQVKSIQGQVFKGVGWIKTMPKRAYFKSYPKAESEDPDELLRYADATERYKQSVSVADAFEYRNVPSETVYFTGHPGDPSVLMEIKLVDELSLMLDYNLTKDKNGNYVDVTTLPVGQNEYRPTYAGARVHVIEYWDREWSLAVVASKKYIDSFSEGNTGVQSGTGINQMQANHSNAKSFKLDAWHHNFGRVPYFCAPFYETDSLLEEERFLSPLEELYAETPYNNQLRTMASNVAYLTGYPSHVLETTEAGDLIIDDKGQRKTHIDLQPAKILQLAPGQKLAATPLPVGEAFVAEVQASDQRMERYSISALSKGSSPGADTANSALSQLRRQLADDLDLGAKGIAIQNRQMMQFWVQSVRDYFQETIYARDPEAGDLVALDPDDCVTMAIDVEVKPDMGSDQMIVEKHYLEMAQLGKIDELEFHTRRGVDNPEEYVMRTANDRMRLSMEPYFQQQLMANLGMLGAIQRLAQANQASGKAADAIPGIMADYTAMQQGKQPTGMGVGSPNAPRAMGVRSPAAQETTQPEMAGING